MVANELLRLIVGYVNKRDYYELAVVNQGWYEAVTPLLWHTLDDGDNVQFMKMTWGLLGSHHQVGRHVRVVHQSCWTDVTFLAWMVQMPYLQQLTVDNGHHLTNLHLLARFCRHLTWVSLHRCKVHWLQCTVTWATLRECVVSVGVWPWLTSLDVDGWTEAQVLAFLPLHPQLTLFHIHQSGLTDASLDAMATHLPVLQSVDLDFNPNITVAGVYRLILACPTITSIHINGCGIYGRDFPDPTISDPHEYRCMMLWILPSHLLQIIRNDPHSHPSPNSERPRFLTCGLSYRLANG